VLGNGGGTAPCSFKRGATVAEMPIPSNIMGNLMVYQDQIKTNLLQPFAHPEN